MPASRSFLFTDIESSSALWEKAPSAMERAVARHDAILVEAVAANDGRVVKMLGDGMYAVFEDPAAAVSAAVDGMRHLDAEDWPEPTPIRVRMGINTGEAQERGGDYFGPTINRTARIAAKANGGQIVVSRQTLEVGEETFPVDFAINDLGTVPLRGISEPVEVAQVTAPGLDLDFPPLRGVATPNNLPSFQTTFVGREQQTRLIGEALRSSSLVTLVGPGGSGKTRLGIEAAWHLLGEYADGVWFVDLAQIADNDLVADAVARALGGSEGATATDLVTELESQTVLVILDNCEHLIEGAAHIAVALSAVDSVKVLATSQRRLNLSGERVFDVEPLEVGAIDDQTSPAVLLFMDRARSATGRFSPSDQERKAIVDTVHRLDGIPLAVELAAVRTRLMSPIQIAERLDEMFSLLSTGTRDARPHQETLEAAFAWSYDLLEAKEQLMFDRISVFIGDFSLLSAVKVVAYDTIGKAEAFDLLAGLVDKSLLRRVEVGEDQILRFRMLETARAYAAQQLETRGERTEIQRRHADLFATSTSDTEDVLRGPDQSTFHLRLTANTSNLLAALTWLNKNDPERAVSMSGQLGRLWYRRGLYQRGKETIEAALEVGPTKPSVGRARAFGWLAFFTDSLGDRDRARELSTEALEVARTIDAPSVVAFALNGLAGYAYDEGHLSEAADLWRDSVAELDRSGSEFVTAPLFNLGYALVTIGDFEEAGEVAKRLEGIGTSQDDQYSTGMAMLLRGYAALGSDRLDQAKESARNSLDVFSVLRSTPQISEALTLLSSVAELSGDVDTAREEFEKAREAMGGWRGFDQTEAHMLLARIAIRAGDLEEGTEALRNGFRAHQDDPNTPNAAALVHETARLARLRGDVDQAAELMGLSAHVLRQHQLKAALFHQLETNEILGSRQADLVHQALTAGEAVKRAEEVLDQG